jgi:hypothetical protein
LASACWRVVRDSTPARRRQRYGDMDFDWEHRVNTTGATVRWQDRLLGELHSPYQPTEPGLFHEMLDSLKIDFREFVFVDLGSGKGRALLMAADYPFRRIIGVELLRSLHGTALENIARYTDAAQPRAKIESICTDAREFIFPVEPLVLYLFNPLREVGLTRVIANLENSLRDQPRPVYVLYHNPLSEHLFLRSSDFRKIGGTHQYAVFISGTARPGAAAEVGPDTGSAIGRSSHSR